MLRTVVDITRRPAKTSVRKPQSSRFLSTKVPHAVWVTMYRLRRAPGNWGGVAYNRGRDVCSIKYAQRGSERSLRKARRTHLFVFVESVRTNLDDLAYAASLVCGGELGKGQIGELRGHSG